MKYAIITGAGSGQGLKAVQILSEMGYFVFACDIFLDNFKETKFQNVNPMYMDVTSNEQINSVYNQIIGVTNKIDVIINFASIGLMDSLIEGSVERIQKVLEVNVIGMVKVNKAFFPLVYNAKGRIINIGSEHGWETPEPFLGAYSMSKHAVRIYTDALRRELNMLGVKVIEIMPGNFESNFNAQIKSHFNELRQTSKLYSNALIKMSAYLEEELNKVNDFKYLKLAITDAVNSRRPKIRYKVKSSSKKVFMSLLPTKLADSLFLDEIK